MSFPRTHYPASPTDVASAMFQCRVETCGGVARIPDTFPACGGTAAYPHPPNTMRQIPDEGQEGTAGLIVNGEEW